MLFTHTSAGVLVPYVYNGYTLNSVTGVESGETGTRLWAINPRGAFDYISESLQWRDGMEVYQLTEVSKIIVFAGAIHGATKAAVGDTIKALANAFDPSNIAWNNDDMFLPLTFTTVETTPVASKFLMVPIERPEPLLANTGLGYGARFSIPMLARDPRRYAQTAISRTGAGALTNSVGNYRSWPTITFTMSGAGNASFTVGNTGTRQGAKSIIFDLSGRVNTQAITLDFDRTRVLVDGVETQAIFKSGDWFSIEPGTNTLTFANTTNAGTITTTTNPAFSY